LSSIDIVQVENVNQYLDVIASNNLYEYVSRGQAKQYPTLDSSAFRLDEPRMFKSMVKAYFETIGNELTPMQEKHFLAFSQHHGIPTNLIDFTNRHLVSLFFACYDTEKCAGQSGYIKFIKSDRLINCNNLIINFEYGEGLLNKILGVNEVTKSFSYIAAEIHKKNPSYIVEHFFELVDLLKEIDQKKVFYAFYELVEQHKNNILSNYTFKDYPIYGELLAAIYKSCEHEDANFFISDEKRLTSIKDYMKHRNYFSIDLSDINLYLLLLNIVFLEYLSLFGRDNNPEKIELPFYLTYIPPNIDNRIASQSSIFIYQLFYEGGHVYGKEYSDIFWQQKINTDFEIEVTDKKGTLAQLDKLGVNLMTIYNDYDNIAKYIKSSI